MQTYVPPRVAASPAASAASARFAASAGQIGSAKETCATRPSPKNVSARWRVRSMNWSGMSARRGTCSSLRLPTAEAERSASQPSALKAQTLAR